MVWKSSEAIVDWDGEIEEGIEVGGEVRGKEGMEVEVVSEVGRCSEIKILRDCLLMGKEKPHTSHATDLCQTIRGRYLH